MKRFFLALLMMVNQAANTITGGNPDESLSSRLGRARDRGSRFASGACRVLDVLDPKADDHCDRAVRHHRESLTASLEEIK